MARPDCIAGLLWRLLYTDQIRERRQKVLSMGHPVGLHRSGERLGGDQQTAQQCSEQQPADVRPTFAPMPATGAEHSGRGFKPAPQALTVLERTQVAGIGVEPMAEFDALTGSRQWTLQVDIPAQSLKFIGIGWIGIGGWINASLEHADHGALDAVDAYGQQMSDVGVGKVVQAAEQENLLSLARQPLDPATIDVEFLADGCVWLPGGQGEQGRELVSHGNSLAGHPWVILRGRSGGIIRDAV